MAFSDTYNNNPNSGFLYSYSFENNIFRYRRTISGAQIKEILIPGIPEGACVDTLSNGDLATTWAEAGRIKLRIFDTNGSPKYPTVDIGSLKTRDGAGYDIEGGGLSITGLQDGGFIIAYSIPDTTWGGNTSIWKLFGNNQNELKSGGLGFWQDDLGGHHRQEANLGVSIPLGDNSTVILTKGSNAHNNSYVAGGLIAFNDGTQKKVTFAGSRNNDIFQLNGSKLSDGRVAIVYSAYDGTNVNLYTLAINKDGSISLPTVKVSIGNGWGSGQYNGAQVVPDSQNGGYWVTWKSSDHYKGAIHLSPTLSKQSYELNLEGDVALLGEENSIYILDTTNKIISNFNLLGNKIASAEAGKINLLGNTANLEIPTGGLKSIFVDSNLSITFSSTPKEGAGVFTTSINLTAGTQTTGNLAEGSTVYWKVSGITADDLVSGALTGTGTITNGKLDIQHSLKVDADTGEKFEVSIYSDADRTQQIGITNSFAVLEAPVVRSNSLYTIVDGPSWTQAEANSVKLGGHLVSIGSKAEDIWLSNNLYGSQYFIEGGSSSSGNLIQSYFIGLNDYDNEGIYKWTSGELLTYGGFAPPPTFQVEHPNNAYTDVFVVNSNASGESGHWINVDNDVSWYRDGNSPGVSRIIKGIAETPFIRRGDSAYVIVQGPTWEEAEANAVKLGGHLATINDAAENNWIYQSFGIGKWIGLSDKATEGSFKWASGESVTYTNWVPGEPSNSGDIQDYVWMQYAPGMWDDLQNDPNVNTGIAEIKLAPNNPLSGTPTLSGTFKAGQVISIDKNPIQDADNFSGYSVPYNYSWEVSTDGTTWTKLTSTDATDNNSTYTLTTADVGKKVRGVVSYLDGYGTNEVVYSATSTQVVPLADSGTGMLAAITGSGAFNEGVTLTAGTIKGDPDGDATNPNYKYQWLLNGIAITGATNATYTVGATGLGNYSVQETYTDAGGFTATITSQTQAIGKIDNGRGTAAAITANSTFNQGVTLTAGAVSGDVDGDAPNPNYKYQWLLNGIAIQGATTATYKTNVFTGAGTYAVQETYTDAQGFTATINSPSQVVATTPITTSINFSSTPQEGAGEFTASLNVSAGTQASINLADGARIYWKITGIQQADLATGYALAGDGIITNGKLDVKSYLVQDNTQENETFNITLYSDAALTQRVGNTFSSVITADIGSSSSSSASTTTLASTISRLTLTGVADINGTGNSLNNYITGNDGNNIIDGGAGNDILAGGKGNDTYIVDSIYDAIIENSNEGTDTVNSSVSWTLGSNLENLNLTGANATNATGNSLNNVITGNDAANILDGGAGDDILDGGAGNNTLTGGLGADTFKLSYSKFTNTIKDYDPLTDRIEINRSNFGLSNIGSNWSLVQTTSSPNTVAFNNLLAMENRAAFIYNTQTGNLYLNQNATIGYMGSIFARTGNGLLVASFANKPNISATNLNLI